MAAALPLVGAIFSFIGMGQQGQADKRTAASDAALRQYQAGELEQAATEQVAISQREMLNEQRRAELLESRALAVAAASGNAADPQVARLVGRIGAEGANRAATALYEGERAARGLRSDAYAKRLGAENLVTTAENKAGAYTLMGLGSAAGTLYERYGKRRYGGTRSSGTQLASAPALPSIDD